MDNEMDMVIHDAEVFDLEVVLLFRPGNDGEKEFLGGGWFEEHFTAVNFDRDMVIRAVHEQSILTHSHIYGIELGYASKISPFWQKKLKKINGSGFMGTAA